MPNTKEINSCNVMDISNRNTKNKCVKLRKEIREPVQPIKDLSDIQKAKDYLFNKEGRYSITSKRDYAIFVNRRVIGSLIVLYVVDRRPAKVSRVQVHRHQHHALLHVPLIIL